MLDHPERSEGSAFRSRNLGDHPNPAIRYHQKSGQRNHYPGGGSKACAAFEVIIEAERTNKIRRANERHGMMREALTKLGRKPNERGISNTESVS